MFHETLLAKIREKAIATLNRLISNTHSVYPPDCSKFDAQKILDALQTVSTKAFKVDAQLLNHLKKLLDTNSFPDRKQLTTAMRRLSRHTNLYPTQLFLKGPPKTLGDEPFTACGFTDIYKVVFQGRDMCFKAIRHYTRPHVEHMAKVYAKEAIAWAQLSHPNILPFFGLARIGSQLAFVSPWAVNGNIVDYLVNNPHVNRLLLCADTAAGMEYLHENDIVHGDLKGYNVVIDSFGRAALCDFGLSSTTDPQILQWSMQSIMPSKGGAVRWQAPELSVEQDDPSEQNNTKESDVFAWATVCYEIFIGRVPYHKITNSTMVLLDIMQGIKPPCPEDSNAAWHKHGLSQQMWGLMEECWEFEASKRPSASDVVARLKENTGFDKRKHGEWTEGLAMRFRQGEGVGDVGDVAFWEELDLLLARVILPNDEARRRILVARKQVTVFLSAIFATTTHYSRLLQCSELDAQKILDAFQTMLDTDSLPDRTQMILAMYRFSKDKTLYPTQLFLKPPPKGLGDLVEVIDSFADIYKATFEGKDTCFRVIRKYYHSDAVHAAEMNVLIDSAGRAALGGFGISGMANLQSLKKWGTQSTMASRGGTVRWQAPELHFDRGYEIYNSKESDIFTWAGLCYEVNARQPDFLSALNLQQIFTGRIPYQEIAHQMSVRLSILQGKKPTRPEASDAAWHKHGLTRQMWGLMEECWAFKASERPSASAVVARLKEIVGPDTREPGEWTDGATMRSRRGEEAGDVRDVKFWEDLISLLTRLVPGLKERYTT
ncbi:hypothetical protein C0993_006293 [Termitomyces sp. T159_Od127]|nr:hypothetical protein C0993_006293 [Termitomyces sp. T159_Od127]